MNLALSFFSTLFFTILISSNVQALTDLEIYESIGNSDFNKLVDAEKVFHIHREGDRSPLYLFYMKKDRGDYIYIGYSPDRLIFSTPIAKCSRTKNSLNCTKLRVTEKTIPADEADIELQPVLINSRSISFKTKYGLGLEVLFQFDHNNDLYSLSIVDSQSVEILKSLEGEQAAEFMATLVSARQKLEANENVATGIAIGGLSIMTIAGICGAVTAVSAGTLTGACIIGVFFFAAVGGGAMLSAKEFNNHKEYLDTIIEFASCHEGQCSQNVEISYDQYDQLKKVLSE